MCMSGLLHSRRGRDMHQWGCSRTNKQAPQQRSVNGHSQTASCRCCTAKQGVADADTASPAATAATTATAAAATRCLTLHDCMAIVKAPAAKEAAPTQSGKAAALSWPECSCLPALRPHADDAVVVMANKLAACLLAALGAQLLRLLLLLLAVVHPTPSAVCFECLGCCAVYTTGHSNNHCHMQDLQLCSGYTRATCCSGQPTSPAHARQLKGEVLGCNCVTAVNCQHNNQLLVAGNVGSIAALGQRLQAQRPAQALMKSRV